MNDKALIDTFLAEAQELVTDIERSLLDLQQDQLSKESISSIFRSMHTLKGAGGMFGYHTVSVITHHLESIYQDIRDDKREMTDIILQLTFRTLDELKILLNAPADVKPGADYDNLLSSIKSIEGDSEGAIETKSTANISTAAVERCYYVYMMPHPGIMKNGNNPLYLVDDLLVLGQGIALPFLKNLPSLEDVTTDLCYMGFEVLVNTDKTEDEIRSVFLFVEDCCDVKVEKLSDENWLKQLTTDEHPWKDRVVTEPIGFNAIQETLRKKYVKKSIEATNVTIKSKSRNIRVSSERLDELMNLVSELVTTQAQLSLYTQQRAATELSAIAENIEKITRRLRDNAFTMSLVPLDSIAVRFQRLVSDLSKELNKEVDFRTEGMETKIDKSIIEKITDPILHLLRNSIDHGIEMPEVRLHNGKKASGVVSIKSYYSGSHVIIEIADDGAGLNVAKIREKAIRQGLIDSAAHLSERELTELIFLPGFSTATVVTGVSGRGVGMDVVRKNITDVGGSVEVSTTAGKGTTFTVRLPLTLSILDGLLVKVGNIEFVLPLSSVVKCFEVETEKLEQTFNDWITLDGKRTPFLFLRKNFGISDEKPYYSQVINVPFNGSHIGLAVDKIVGEYQAVLKPLGKFFTSQEEFSGATILGDGSVALVLDTHKLIRIATAHKESEAVLVN